MSTESLERSSILRTLPPVNAPPDVNTKRYTIYDGMAV